MEAAGRVRRCHQGRAIDETNSSVMCWVTVWGGIQMLTWQQVNTSEVAGYDSSDFYGQWNEFTATRQMRLTRVSGNGTALSRLWWTLVSAFYDWWSAVNPPCVYVLGAVCVCMHVCVCMWAHWPCLDQSSSWGTKPSLNQGGASVWRLWLRLSVSGGEISNRVFESLIPTVELRVS